MAGSIRGKVCLITGATEGIGRATAQLFASRGARVVIVGREPEKTVSTVERIRRESKNDSVEYLLADLSSMESVRRLASQVIARYDRLDVLVHNAGTFGNERRLSPDGIEVTFAVNYLSRFVLTNLLLPLLKRSARSRVIHVNGAYHFKGRIDFEDLNMERGYSMDAANARSKLADILFAYSLAGRLEGTGVTVNCLHPGVVRTDSLLRNASVPLYQKALYWLVRWFFIPPERAAEKILFLSESESLDGVTGKYFVDNKAVPSSPSSYDVGLQKRLWSLSAKLTGVG